MESDLSKTINVFSTVIYGDQLQEFYDQVTFGISCAVENPEYIEIKKNVIVHHHTSLHAITNHYGGYKPSIKIGEGTHIGPYNAISSINQIIIGNNVLFGPYVHINDHSHNYEDIDIPIIQQPAYSKGPIVIEDDCWLGFGCHVMAGVTIGKHSVIGANSVVTKDIPSYSVAVGVPAKVVKKYNFNTQKWEIIGNLMLESNK